MSNYIEINVEIRKLIKNKVAKPAMKVNAYRGTR